MEQLECGLHRMLLIINDLLVDLVIWLESKLNSLLSACCSMSHNISRCCSIVNNWLPSSGCQTLLRGPVSNDSWSDEKSFNLIKLVLNRLSSSRQINQSTLKIRKKTNIQSIDTHLWLMMTSRPASSKGCNSFEFHFPDRWSWHSRWPTNWGIWTNKTNPKFHRQNVWRPTSLNLPQHCCCWPSPTLLHIQEDGLDFHFSTTGCPPKIEWASDRHCNVCEQRARAWNSRP